jgi:hypothetical protein
MSAQYPYVAPQTAKIHSLITLCIRHRSKVGLKTLIRWGSLGNRPRGGGGLMASLIPASSPAAIGRPDQVLSLRIELLRARMSYNS